MVIEEIDKYFRGKYDFFNLPFDNKVLFLR